MSEPAQGVIPEILRFVSRPHTWITLFIVGGMMLVAIALVDADFEQWRFEPRPNASDYWLAGFGGLFFVVVGIGLYFWEQRPSNGTRKAKRTEKGVPSSPQQEGPQEHATASPTETASARKATAQVTEEFRLKVKTLKDKFYFTPDLILGIPRGGLVVAARLAREYGDNPIIPTASFCKRPAYTETLNSFMERIDTLFPKRPGKKYNILLVDDYCERGQTLLDARNLLKSYTGDRNDIDITTATIHWNPGESVSSYKPDETVDDEREPATMRRPQG
jgi:hypoxanthine phosphoribosyltransferase